MIEVKHLTKRYGSVNAVSDLTFRVEKGQIYGFLGPNGAGKTTTMNILTGYIAPTGGKVSVNGHDILEEPEEARKCIGYLPEIPPLYPEMTVYEYLAFAAELKKLPKEEKTGAIAEAMATVGVDSQRNRLIRNLSKGYRQRVGLAQALLGLPEILILDEPMVGLDPKQIIEVRELIRRLSRHHTVILSSHILSEISAICDHIMIIAHGHLVASDTPENLMNRMRESAALELTVRSSRGNLKQMAEQTAGILSFDISSSAEKNAWDMVIRTDRDSDLREKLFYYMAEHKMTLLRMQQTQVSLEEVFLELTGEQEETQETNEGENIAEGSREPVEAEGRKEEEG